jgi:hypothetical protein
MWELLTVFFAVCFLATLLYALKLRAKMASASKAQFAFAACATLAACAFALLSFLSGRGPVWIGNIILSGKKAVIDSASLPDSLDQLTWFIAILGSLVMALALFLIYRFAVHAVRNWEGPPTLNVIQLAKQEKDNNLGALAMAELRPGKKPPAPSVKARRGGFQRLVGTLKSRKPRQGHDAVGRSKLLHARHFR